MSGEAETTVAVLAGLAAACSMGVGAALQHRQVQLAPKARGTPVRLLGHLARRRLWLAGIALAVAAYGLQALALAFGPLALVAPVVATDLLFALPLAAWWARRPMRARDWAGCALAGGGVAVFLAVSPPSLGRSDASAAGWALAFGAVALVAAAAVTAGMLAGGAPRTALLAVAAGVAFGLTAAVTLSLTRLLRRESLLVVLGHWQPWVLLALGTAGLLLSVSAYQAGALSASLPVMDSVEPVSAVLIGTVVFGERLAASPPALALQLAAAAAAVAGIILLGRSPIAGPARPHSANEPQPSVRDDRPPQSPAIKPTPAGTGGM
jgi:drug/metabolite transporter (DMT)-like permease